MGVRPSSYRMSLVVLEFTDRVKREGNGASADEAGASNGAYPVGAVDYS
jgi:hypothetical protein